MVLVAEVDEVPVCSNSCLDIFHVNIVPSHTAPQISHKLQLETGHIVGERIHYLDRAVKYGNRRASQSEGGNEKHAVPNRILSKGAHDT